MTLKILRTPQILRLLQGMAGDVTRAEIMAILDLKDRMHFSGDYIAPALVMGLIGMSIPDKPNSPLGMPTLNTFMLAR